MSAVTARWLAVISALLLSCSERRPAPAAATPAVRPEPAVDHMRREQPVDADSPGACETAFADQRQLYIDPDITVHPDREKLFLELCRRLPAELQRCASPLYQQEHDAGCEAQRTRADAPARAVWGGVFDVLEPADQSLAAPPPR